MDNVVNCVPKLSVKELVAIKDQLDVEMLTISKYEQYERDFDDPELKGICREMAKNHKNHYNTLVKHLNC